MVEKMAEGDTATCRLKEQGFKTGSCMVAYGAQGIK